MNLKNFFLDGEDDRSDRLSEECRDEKVDESVDKATREVARWRLRPRKVADSPDSVLDVVTMAMGTGVRRLLRPLWASGSGEKVTLLVIDSSAIASTSFSPVIVAEIIDALSCQPDGSDVPIWNLVTLRKGEIALELMSRDRLIAQNGNRAGPKDKRK